MSLDVLRATLTELFAHATDRAETVGLLNDVRRLVCEFSPFAAEPVDCVEWVALGQVAANDYNPNSVAPPEMELLRLSIMADGYCVEASTPILCADLTWRPARTLKPGDALIAFDEERDPLSRNHGRHFRTSEVTFNDVREAELFRVATSRGEVLTNSDHPWLAQRLYGSAEQRTLRWIATKDLQPDDLLVKVIEPWEQDISWDAGWLAGFLDGEGSMAQNQTLKNGHARGHRLVGYQRPGRTADRLIEAMSSRVHTTVHVHSHDNPKWNDMVMVRVDRMKEIMRLLGTVRPEQLIEAGGEFWEGASMSQRGSGERVKVIDIEPAGNGQIASLATSTMTYIANGFAMHNTQPIVTNDEDGTRVVIDGFHRNRVARECEDVAARVQGYLPVVQIRGERTDRPDRMASTIRHNRARGKHRVDAMSDIVIELKRRNWTNTKIGRELGMDADEVLRLCQITGLAELFSDQEFSRAWEPHGSITEADFEDLTDDIESYDVREARTVNTSDEGRIFHTHDTWECQKAGFYAGTKTGVTREQGEQMYRAFLTDEPRFRDALDHVIAEWTHSCEHYLTNVAMNRIAWLGQAAMCYATGIPASYRSGFQLLTPGEQDAANETALEYLNRWCAANDREPLDMDAAMSYERQSDIY